MILGLEEKENQFIAIGVEDSSKIKKEFFDVLNNKTMVSKNILDDSKVIVQKIGRGIYYILKCSSEDAKRIRAIERINEEFEKLKKQI